MTLLNQSVGETLFASAAAAAPTANTAVATLGVLSAGVYKVSVTLENTGTQETTNLINARLIRGSTTLVTYPITATPRTYYVDRVVMDGASSLRIIAAVNAIASSNYVVTMHANRIA